MSVYDEVLLAVVNLAQETQPYSTIAIGSMPPENGISMAYSSGSLETYLNKKAAVTMSVVLNGKHDNQQTVLDTLGKIHTYLNMRNTYPQANNFQIVNILTTSPPSYLGREENRQWLYGSSLAIRFYLKGD